GVRPSAAGPGSARLGGTAHWRRPRHGRRRPGGGCDGAHQPADFPGITELRDRRGGRGGGYYHDLSSANHGSATRSVTTSASCRNTRRRRRRPERTPANVGGG